MRQLVLFLIIIAFIPSAFSATKKQSIGGANASLTDKAAKPSRIDLSGTTIIPVGTDKIRVFNVSTKDGRSNMDLQWNPFDNKFDVVQSGIHSTITKCMTTEVENNGYFEVETDAENKTIEVRIVSKRDGGFGEAFRSNGSQYYFDGIIQKGRQLSASAKVENVNSATALVSFEPNYNGMYSIPAGVMRILTLSRIPSWFDFAAPTQGVVWGNRSYRCL